MSSYNSNNKRSAPKPYCKVCHDAGKPESVYTSHWLRASPEPNAKVTCPYLLSLECRYCKEKGHTPKACPMIQAKQDQAKTQAQLQVKAKAQHYIPQLKTIPEDSQLSFTPPQPKPVFIPSPAPIRKATKNSFNVLQSFIEEDERKEQEEEKHQEELNNSFPVIGQSKTSTTKKPTLKGWANIAAKPVPIYKVVANEVAQAPQIQEIAQEPKVQIQAPQIQEQNVQTEVQHKEVEHNQELQKAPKEQTQTKPKSSWSSIACKPPAPVPVKQTTIIQTNKQYNDDKYDNYYSSDEEDYQPKFSSSWDCDASVSWADL